MTPFLLLHNSGWLFQDCAACVQLPEVSSPRYSYNSQGYPGKSSPVYWAQVPPFCHQGDETSTHARLPAACAVLLCLLSGEEHDVHLETWWPWPCPGGPTDHLPGGVVWGSGWGKGCGGDHFQVVRGQDHQRLSGLQTHGAVHQPRLPGSIGSATEKSE